ncbi:MAG TPA: hypothetical protein VLG74_12140, partial [Blastocatellia bacterium]|nr:hypothetical protein [Blastocatellia bacterium]
MLNLLIWPWTDSLPKLVPQTVQSASAVLLARGFVDEVSKALDVRCAASSYEAYALKSFYSSLLSLFSSSAEHREDTRTRSLRVRAIEVSPGKRVGYLNEQVGFAAIGK